MKILLQRVKKSNIEVAGENIANIDVGILVFIGISKGDTTINADKLIDKILKFRVFNDADEKMNLSVKDCEYEVLLVSQFTLAADTKSGTRAGFSTAMPPQEAEILYDYFVKNFKQKHTKTQTGIFGADMQISLINDGPISFILEN